MWRIKLMMRFPYLSLIYNWIRKRLVKLRIKNIKLEWKKL